MYAKQRGGAEMLVSKDGKPAQPGRQIFLAFEELVARHGITAATVTVLGTSARQRIVQAGKSPDPMAEAFSDKRTTLSLTFASPGQTPNQPSVSVNLPFDGFTSITSIRLQSLIYADGSAWTTPPNAYCHTVPDPAVLINASIARRIVDSPPRIKYSEVLAWCCVC